MQKKQESILKALRRRKKKLKVKKRNLKKLSSLLYKLSLSSTLVFFSACGYKLSEPKLYQSYQTIEVPYVKGDVNGQLTAKIISSLSSNTLFSYAPSQGDLILRAEILNKESVHIGFQYDRKADGSSINRLVPNESRYIGKVKVTLLSGKTDEVLYGPFEVSAGTDYDFVNSDTYTDLSFINQSGVTTSVLPFSLGQLNAWQEASDATLSVLYRKIAENIVQSIEDL